VHMYEKIFRAANVRYDRFCDFSRLNLKLSSVLLWCCRDLIENLSGCPSYPSFWVAHRVMSDAFLIRARQVSGDEEK
jgi:hypothetical protein